MNTLPVPLVTLMNKTDEGFHGFAFGTSARALRVTRSDDWKRWRVERLTLTNKDPVSPRGTWHTVASLADEEPAAKLHQAMEILMREQQKMVNRLRSNRR